MAQDLTSTIVEKKNRGIGIADIATAATAATEVEQEYRNDGRITAYVYNGDAAPITATLKSQKDSNGRGGPGDEDNDEAITVPAGGIGIFPWHKPDGFNSGGKSKIVLSAFANVEVLLVRQVQ